MGGTVYRSTEAPKPQNESKPTESPQKFECSKHTIQYYQGRGSMKAYHPEQKNFDGSLAVLNVNEMCDRYLHKTRGGVPYDRGIPRIVECKQDKKSGAYYITVQYDKVPGEKTPPTFTVPVSAVLNYKPKGYEPPTPPPQEPPEYLGTGKLYSSKVDVEKLLDDMGGQRPQKK